MASREPVSDAVLLNLSEELWRRNAGHLWSNIDATERVLMAYAHPAACWAARDDLLRPCAVSGWHHARSEARIA